MAQHEQYEAIVVGGGFFGCSLATELKRFYSSVLLVEKESDLLQRASYVNQARVHNGYHYPRHFLTAVRSRVNFPRFVEEYKDCIVNDFEKYYAVGTKYSKTTAAQFRSIMERVGSPIEKAPEDFRKLFNPDLIEDVFTVREYAFDSVKLKKIASARMLEAGVEVLLNHTAAAVKSLAGASPFSLQLQLIPTQSKQGASSKSDVISISAKQVFNCTYSNINSILTQSNLPLIPLKHEVTEMSMIELPDSLKNKSVTVMCGPFFSFMPFPPLGLTSFSHVRYTPHCHWYDGSAGPRSPMTIFDEFPRVTNFPAMIRDAVRFLPALSEAKYRSSLWEVKTTLPASEQDDGRPILFRPNHGLPGLTCIMGGKIDNVYEIAQEIESVMNGARNS